MTIYHEQRYEHQCVNDIIPWWIALSVQPNASNEVVIAAYKVLCKQYHPDVGGTKEAMQYINEAFDKFKKERWL